MNLYHQLRLSSNLNNFLNKELTTKYIALFKYTTTSYKFLFLRSILKRVTNGESTLDINEIVLDIMVEAWYPNQYFKLSFGCQDKISKLFEKNNFEINEKTPITSPRFSEILRKQIKIKIDLEQLSSALSRYVKFRLLTPFFTSELRSKPDSQKNKIIQESALVYYESRRPLYKIEALSNNIHIHPCWCDFITSHSPLLLSYLQKKWGEFLQNKNPNIPAIVFKTHPPIDRPPLDRQRQCWIDLIEKKKVKCIYSDKTLSPKALSLDHFIPWSFVCHNKAWNLIPTLKSINSSKGNQLPCLDNYLEKFIDTQLFLMQFHFAEDSKNWKHLSEDLAVDLKLDPGEIYTSPNQFRDKLASTIISQHTLAQQLGFQNWNLQH